MLIRRLYSIELSESVPEKAHFEFRIDSSNRAFHISIRNFGQVLIINNMVNGKWGKEHEYRTNSSLVRSEILLVDVFADKVVATIRDVRVVYKVDKKHLVATTFSVDSAGVQHREIATFGSFPYLRDERTGEVRSVQIVQKNILIPKGYAGHAERIATSAVCKFDDYLGFIGSRPLGAPLVIFDLFQSEYTAALLGALLLPKSRVYKVCFNQNDQEFIDKLASINELKNISGLSERAFYDALKRLGAESHVLLQGEQVAQRLELVKKCINQLGAQVYVSLYAREERVLPGNVYSFEAASIRNTRVEVLNSPWVLNKSEHGSAAGLREGLDIVVAAYNCKSFLVSCVDSLLSQGRDDVRVIVVNDGSTDGGELLVRSKFKDDARVRVEDKPNGGCASARNYGRLVSNASHIAFVDADDFVSRDFFADLYDLAIYTGNEMVQAGFDFYDESQSTEFQFSYEEHAFARHERVLFKGRAAINVQAKEMIKGQPTIWRRVYRRDFLDAKNVYFPENVRAYDDYIFHLVSLTEARDVWMLPEHKYHYRQHSAQDVKAGDERHFYMIYMFGLLLRRSVDEGWSDFYPYAQSIIDSIEWSSRKLRADLVNEFLEAAARFCLSVEKVYGDQVMASSLLSMISHPDFMYHYQKVKETMAHVPPGVHWSYFIGSISHPDILRMHKKLEK